MQKKTKKQKPSEIHFVADAGERRRRRSGGQQSVTRCMARDNERKGREGSGRGTERGEEGRRRRRREKRRRSEGRLLLILPYLSLFAETPFVFQVPVIRA